MPPPPWGALPLAIVNPEMFAVTPEIVKIRKSPTPPAERWTVNRFAPGPLMVRFLLINKSPLVSVIAARSGAKLIVSPETAVAIAWRRVQLAPGQVPPASAVLVTVIAAGAEIAANKAAMMAVAEQRERDS